MKLYKSLYDELYERVPNHPQLNARKDHEKQSFIVSLQMEFLSKFLASEQTFLEIGCGNCCLSFEVSKYVSKVYGVDVSKLVTYNDNTPNNFKLIMSDGISIAVLAESIDIAYSNQLLEHLHPEDMKEHLQQVYRILVFGGKYICITPHRYMGPHDISGYFENESKGFHLHEYTNKELKTLFKNTGFTNVHSYIRVRGYYAKCSFYPAIFVEYFIESIPHGIRKIISRTIFKQLLAIRLIATK